MTRPGLVGYGRIGGAVCGCGGVGGGGGRCDYSHFFDSLIVPTAKKV